MLILAFEGKQYDVQQTCKLHLFADFRAFTAANSLYLPCFPRGKWKSKEIGHCIVVYIAEKKIMKCECKKSFRPQKIWFYLNILKNAYVNSNFFFIFLYVLRRELFF